MEQVVGTYIDYYNYLLIQQVLSKREEIKHRTLQDRWRFAGWLLSYPILLMSITGNCYENEPMESFFGPLKTECVTDLFATRAEAR